MQYASGKTIQGKVWKNSMSNLGGDNCRWVEPFCGALGAYRQIAPTYNRSLISDLSPIAKMWQAVKDGWLPKVMPLTKKQYKKYQSIAYSRNPTPQSVYNVHQFGYLAHAGGSLSVGSHWGDGIKGIEAIGETLRELKTEIRQCDYRETLNECGRGDVVYLDPPYGKGLSDRWIVANNNVFDEYEMLVLAVKAVCRGAIIFISHYNANIDPTRWAAVHTHRDQATINNAGKIAVKRIREYLYVDIGTYNYYEFQQNGKPGLKTNRTSKQAVVRRQLREITNACCEATGEHYINAIGLELAHAPGYTYAETHDVNIEHCYLVNALFHAYIDKGWIQITADHRWDVNESIRSRPECKNAHGKLTKRFRTKH
jgi:site-specific DNA-adenine methylase